MEILFELLFQFLGEIILQIVFEVLAEFGLRILREPFRQPPHPWLASLGYALLGAFAGGISLLFFPSLFLLSQAARLANLLLTPIAAGLVMAALGVWRRKHDQPLLRIDRFAYGFLFALAMASVRFFASE
jgi:hypothetical protein